VANRLVVAGPLVERLGRTQKGLVFDHLEGATGAFDQALEALAGAVACGFHTGQVVTGDRVEVGLEPLVERLRLVVVDGEAVCAEFVAEVTHRGEDERELLDVVGMAVRERFGLDHEDAIAVGVGPGKWAVGSEQLVAEDPNCHMPHSASPPLNGSPTYVGL